MSLLSWNKDTINPFTKNPILEFLFFIIGLPVMLIIYTVIYISFLIWHFLGHKGR